MCYYSGLSKAQHGSGDKVLNILSKTRAHLFHKKIFVSKFVIHYNNIATVNIVLQYVLNGMKKQKIHYSIQSILVVQLHCSEAVKPVHCRKVCTNKHLLVTVYFCLMLI